MRQINLLPLEDQKKGQFIVIRNLLVWTFVPMAVVLFLLHGIVVLWLGVLNTFVQNPYRQQETAHAQQLQQQIALVKSSIRDFVEKNPGQVRLFVVPLSMTDILTNISNAALDKIWLNEFSIDLSKQTCELAGESYTTRLVSEFMLQLRELPYFKKVDLVSMEKDDPRQGEGVRFKVSCKLK